MVGVLTQWIGCDEYGRSWIGLWENSVVTTFASSAEDGWMPPCRGLQVRRKKMVRSIRICAEVKPGKSVKAVSGQRYLDVCIFFNPVVQVDGDNERDHDNLNS
jgi:hypothetical protein